MKEGILPTAARPPARSRIPHNVSLLVAVLVSGYILGFLTAGSSSGYSSPLPQDQVQIFPPETHEHVKAPQKEITFGANESSSAEKAVMRVAGKLAAGLFVFRETCGEAVPDGEVAGVIIEKVFDGVSPYHGFPSPETAEALLPPAVRPRGWGSRNQVFADLVREVRPRTIIELGTFLGGSALHMAELTRNMSMPETTIVCVDDFRGWPGFRASLRGSSKDLPKGRNGDTLLLQQFMAGVVAAGEERRVIPMPFSTGGATAALCEWGVQADLVEVDAGHDFHSAWADINAAYALVRPGGVLFGHDYYNKVDRKGVQRAVQLFAAVKGLAVRPHGQHWVLSPKPSAAPPLPSSPQLRRRREMKIPNH